MKAVKVYQAVKDIWKRYHRNELHRNGSMWYSYDSKLTDGTFCFLWTRPLPCSIMLNTTG